MNERTKELAEQAGIEIFKVNGRDVFYFDAGLALDEIERFAELVRQDEREHIKQENQRCYVGSEKYRSQK